MCNALKEISLSKLICCQEFMKSVVNCPFHRTFTDEEVQTMLICIKSLSLGRRGFN